MSKALITESHLTDIANAIIAKGGATAPMTPAQMPAAIQAIPSGGGVRFGVGIDSFIGEIIDGYYVKQSVESEFVINEEVSVNTTDFKYLFISNKSISKFSIHNLKDVNVSYAFQSALEGSSVENVEIHGISTGSRNGDRTFICLCRNCKNLISANLDNTIPIAHYGFEAAFEGCTNLKKLSLKGLASTTNGLYKICKGCINLEYVYLNNLSIASTYDFREGAFSECSKLKAVHFDEATAIPMMYNANAFSAAPSTMKIVVPDGLYDDWIIANNWSVYASNIIKVSEYAGE